MMKALPRFPILIVALGVLLTTSGCFHHHKHVRNQPPASDAPRAPKVRYIPQFLEPAQQVSMPKKTYTYQYYPSVNVYYDTTRELYFFTDGEDWQETAQLPSQFILDQNEAVTMKLKTDKPFLSEVSRSFWDPFTW